MVLKSYQSRLKTLDASAAGSSAGRRVLLRSHHARTPRNAAFAAVAPTFAVAMAPAFTTLAAARGDGGA